MNRPAMLTLFFYFVMLAGCDNGSGGGTDPDVTPYEEGKFLFGADLSYANQIVDHGGVFHDGGEQRSPNRIFADHGTNLVRLRLWHNPVWTKEVYGDDGVQLYNDINDVKKSIQLAHAQGMKVLLDFHYSDNWADPGKQEPPAAWINIKSIDVLSDSVYNYTFKTLEELKAADLMPEFVQLGNEINCGMFFTNIPDGFPSCNVCNGAWTQLGKVINKGIDAVRDVSVSATTKPEIILHVADPKNVDWWFDNIQFTGLVTDFDRIGFSYYPLWHTTISIQNISSTIKRFRSKYKRDIMIMETGYPWTAAANDSYNNLFGSQTPVSGYPYTEQGQFALMKELTRQVINGGGAGVIYWEPDWITSSMKDQWGTGSAWENTALFNFDGGVVSGINYMKEDYH